MKTRLLFSIIIISFLGVNTSKAQEIQSKIAQTQIENGVSRKANFNLEEIKVRWKKSALENCTGTPCVSGNTCSAGMASFSPTVNRGSVMPSITHVTVGATGIGTITNLPQGITATWSNNTILISGTPLNPAVGTYIYSILLTGCTNSISATGTIIVTNNI
jgi:hypothetical protein